MAKTQIRSEDVRDATITDTDVAAANKDGAKATPSMRTLSASAPANIGTAAAGSAVTGTSSDHVHATGAGTPTTAAFGDAAAIGAGPAAAMTNHVHGMPTATAAYLSIMRSANSMGSAFPGSPATNDLFFRTDLGMEFQWDGTRWLCTCPHVMTVGPGNAVGLAATAATAPVAPAPVPIGSDIWLVKSSWQFLVSGGTALSASHSWRLDLMKRPTGNTDTNIYNSTVASGASSVWRATTTTIGALMNSGTVHFVLATVLTKTGTPGNLFYQIDLTYRYVAT